ncbi:MAG: type II toxin-antitoxin system RelE/ParE family toxin [Chlamydiae bacterium]|nr:type II toxin-antitoxin system RelE/ParE family toxin [Chlamydiota bacterium]
MKIIIAKLAQQEFDEAKEYYEIEQAGLGRRFEQEIRQSLLRIKQFPLGWPMEEREVRRYLVHKFPYKILYSVQEKEMVVLAFAHFHRRPGYWIERVRR